MIVWPSKSKDKRRVLPVEDQHIDLLAEVAVCCRPHVPSPPDNVWAGTSQEFEPDILARITLGTGWPNALRAVASRRSMSSCRLAQQTGETNRSCSLLPRHFPEGRRRRMLLNDLLRQIECNGLRWISCEQEAWKKPLCEIGVGISIVRPCVAPVAVTRDCICCG